MRAAGVRRVPLVPKDMIPPFYPTAGLGDLVVRGACSYWRDRSRRAQVSRMATVRLNTRDPSVESGSTQK